MNSKRNLFTEICKSTKMKQNDSFYTVHFIHKIMVRVLLAQFFNRWYIHLVCYLKIPKDISEKQSTTEETIQGEIHITYLIIRKYMLHPFKEHKCYQIIHSMNPIRDGNVWFNIQTTTVPGFQRRNCKQYVIHRHVKQGSFSNLIV